MDAAAANLAGIEGGRAAVLRAQILFQKNLANRRRSQARDLLSGGGSLGPEVRAELGRDRPCQESTAVGGQPRYEHRTRLLVEEKLWPN